MEFNQKPQDILADPAQSEATDIRRIGHDIKNILTGLRGYTELTRRECFSPAQVLHNCAELETCLDRLTAIADGLMNVQRAERVSLAERSRHACAQLGSQAELHHVRIHTTLDERAVVLAAPAEIDAVVANLLTNALDALEHGGDIRLTTSIEPSKAVLCVEDTGGGVPPDLVPRLFLQSFTTKRGGHGIGLPSVQRTVNKLGGSIEVDNHPGRGLAVVLGFPLAPEKDVG